MLSENAVTPRGANPRLSFPMERLVEFCRWYREMLFDKSSGRTRNERRHRVCAWLIEQCIGEASGKLQVSPAESS